MSDMEKQDHNADASKPETVEKLAKIEARNDASKIATIRLIFLGIALLMAYLGLLVAVNWKMPAAVDRDGLGAAFFQTSKDILLVLTGILGSAMSSVFDSKKPPDNHE